MCQMEQSFLQEFIDGSLTPLEKVILEEHLRICAECRRELNKLKILDWDLRNFYHEETCLPSELSALGQSVLQSCFTGETGQKESGRGITSKDILQLQVTTLNNSLKFITLMTPLTRKEKPKPPATKRKNLLLRKIIGL